jgi:hypothetical protein
LQIQTTTISSEKMNACIERKTLMGEKPTAPLLGRLHWQRRQNGSRYIELLRTSNAE